MSQEAVEGIVSLLRGKKEKEKGKRRESTKKLIDDKNT